MSPLDYLAAERAADAAGKTLLGFYHSHPEHPAEPSATDLAWAQPNFVYLIMSIRRRRSPDSEPAAPAAAGAGAFLLDPDRSGFLTDEFSVRP